MRILHISTRLILGGSQENTVLSCEGQARLGHDVHLAFGPIYGPEGSLLERVEKFRASGTDGTTHRITTHVVPHMVRELNPIKDALAYHELRRLVRKLQPDVIHTHSSKAGILGRIATWDEFQRDCAIDPAPPIGFVWWPIIVHTVHGPPFHAYEKKWRNALYILAERWAAKRCYEIITVCDAMRDQFLAANIGKREQYVTVYSGMEVESYLEPTSPDQTRDVVRQRLGIREDEIVIGTVARLAEHKGHDDVLDALADDVKSNAKLRLLWVGDGWWRERLSARIDAMGLAGRVTLTGLVPPEEIPGLMRAMDVLVHPSYREGLPRTVPQALLAGTPVVASDVDGTREACIDFETGRLYPVSDVAKLRDAVRWMLDDRERASATAERGRELCRERFSTQAMVNELEKAYAHAEQLGKKRWSRSGG